MSRFTRNRWIARQKQESERRIQEENSKQFDKAMEAHSKTAAIIMRTFPFFDMLSSEDASKLYMDIYLKVKEL